MASNPAGLHFSWISSAEATKFQHTVIKVTESVKALGPATAHGQRHPEGGLMEASSQKIREAAKKLLERGHG